MTTLVEYPWRQLPAGISPVTDFRAFWAWAESVADPRVQDWPLMASIVPTLVIFMAYIAFILIGKKLMANRKPFDLTGLMTAYNLTVIVLNAYLFIGIVSHVFSQGYNLVCNPVDYGPEGQDLVWFIYCYYLSKGLDFSDTIFMVLRKKNDQVSFLHVYHHGLMWIIWWSATKWSGGGNAVVGPIMNTFIHFVMYSYYLASTYKIKIPGKRYLTQMQMAQLAILLQHSVLSVAVDCPYPHWTQYTQVAFMITLLILFGNFYINSYNKGKKGASKSKLESTSTPNKKVSGC